MLQCRIGGRGTGNAGEWEALTQGTQGKKTNLSLHTYCEFQSVFCSQSYGVKYSSTFPSHPLGLLACFLCRRVEKKSSYPTQLSGPRLVKWMGRYG